MGATGTLGTRWHIAGRSLLLVLCTGLPASAQPAAGYPPPGQPPPGQPPPGQQPYGPQGYQPPAKPAPYQQRLGPYQKRWQPVEEDPMDRPSYVAADRHYGRHKHDGWYLRLAGGIGLLRDAGEAENLRFEREGVEPLELYDETASGTAALTELAVGYALTTGFVLALAVNTASAPSPSAPNPGVGTGDNDFRLTHLTVAGPMVDVYPVPTLGLHLQGLVGVGIGVVGETLLVPERPKLRSHTATGWGFGLGIGYEWWIADDWGLGLLARVNYASTSGPDVDSNDWSHGFLAPGLLLTLTYN